jgi:hypothetical protein
MSFCLLDFGLCRASATMLALILDNGLIMDDEGMHNVDRALGGGWEWLNSQG